MIKKNYNYISAGFWRVPSVQGEMEPLDRYLFLYFLTNSMTNFSGIYECPLELISHETRLAMPLIEEILKRLKSKITYIKGWVFIKNRPKYRHLKSSAIEKEIVKEINSIPPIIVQEFEKTTGVQISSFLPKSIKISAKKNENGFDTWWSFYPRKEAKKKALASWVKIKPNKELQKTMLVAILKRKESDEWLEDSGKYIPLAATWLNGERWEDVIPENKDEDDGWR